MNQAPGFARRFAQQERGATAIEYALISGLIALMLAASVPGISAALSALFGTIVAAFAGA